MMMLEVRFPSDVCRGRADFGEVDTAVIPEALEMQTEAERREARKVIVTTRTKTSQSK